jgi:hypothetical protein
MQELDCYGPGGENAKSKPPHHHPHVVVGEQARHGDLLRSL